MQADASGNRYFWNPATGQVVVLSPSNLVAIDRATRGVGDFIGFVSYTPTYPIDLGGDTIRWTTDTALKTPPGGTTQPGDTTQPGNTTPPTNTSTNHSYTLNGQVLNFYGPEEDFQWMLNTTPGAVAGSSITPTGPTGYTGNTGYTGSTGPGTPSDLGVNWDSIDFEGQIGIVRFSGQDPNSIYLVDPSTKTIQKFASADAIKNFGPLNGATLENLITLNKVPTISLNLLTAQGYTSPTSANDISNSGVDPLALKKQDAAITQHLNFYGGTGSEDQNKLAARYLIGDRKVNGFLRMSGLSESILNEVYNNPNLLAFYINAIGYGGYSLNDVYSDIKRRELIKNGNTELANVRVINQNVKKSEYAASNEGKAAFSRPEIQPPASYSNGISSSTLGTSINVIPDAAYKILVPLLDKNSPEFRAAVDKIQSLYYDVLMQDYNADNERAHAIAKETWRQFKEQTEKALGITLSDSAIGAWDQIQGLGNQASTANLYGSGIHQEAIDRKLARVRLLDERGRDSTATKEDQERQNFFTKSASSTEMINGVFDPQTGKLLMAPPTAAERKAWGLEVSPEDRAFYTLENLRKLAPDEPDSYLQKVIDAHIDTSTGTPLYRSVNYQTYMDQWLDAQKNKKIYQEGRVEQDYLQEEKKAYLPYTQAGIGERAPEAPNTGSSATGIVDANTGFSADNLPKAGGITTTQQSTSDKLAAESAATLKAAQDAAKQSGTGTTTTNTLTPTLPKSTYSGTSIVDYLKSIGQASDYTSRAALAASKGISGYSGTAEQNTKLLGLLKSMSGF
jgi:hypothetical protein